MHEKPDIADELIIAQLQKEYGLHVISLIFLPLGADKGTAVYRVITDEGRAYFLKLRKNFNEIIVSVPLLLKSRGIREIISPLDAKSKHYWASLADYKLILFPFIEGKDGFGMELASHHRRILGTALKKIHSAQIPPELKRLIPQETFSPYWREMMMSFQGQVENKSFNDPTAVALAGFMRSKRSEITRLIEQAERLASILRSKPVDLVLCHTDLHGGNILISKKDELYIVDWDNPLLAPIERDLMFIGGGIDEIWKSKQDEIIFYQGYGAAETDTTMLAYYRYERVIEDLVAYCELLLLTDEGGTDREPAYEEFTRNFEPGHTIEIADRTDRCMLT